MTAIRAKTGAENDRNTFLPFARVSRDQGTRLVRFGVVGVGATFVYAIVAYILAGVFPRSAALASLIAFSISGVVSYYGHRLFTFKSGGSHARSAPRFVGVNLLAYGFSAAIPWILSDWLGYRPTISIAIVCIVIPVMNYLLLNLFVFKGDDAPHA